ncbi:hypothetical protein LFL96_21155 [Paraburkholderia sp. D15]|uniref:hypothetical protein n=1 Tax=Paraburkholderia sp. D15 TaxID=2880218 RepID=UPI0024796AFE|nr:hypothetical protein [Paraburkholderia sp. D15]WGS53568.1 hypothetical protein LFL96_21155 [Paraburkholderia sp. D15]
MGQPVHTVEVPDGFQLAQPDRLLVGNLPNQANAAGSGAGATVVIPFTGLKLPATYSVLGCMSQAGDLSVGNKTQTGFTVTLTPSASTVTLAAGTFDLLIVA